LPFLGFKPADVVLGQADFTSNLANRGGLVASNTLDTPIDPVFDSIGNLLLSDFGNNRLLQYSALDTDGHPADFVFGQADFTSDAANRGGSVAANTLNGPTNPTFESSGDIWVSDSNNHRILEYPAAFVGSDPAITVLGQADFTSNLANRGGSVAANTLNVPDGLAFDLSGNLFASDSDNNRVLRFSAPFTDGEAAGLVLGQEVFTISFTNGPLTSETLLSSNVIRVTIDQGTASEKIAFFDLACNKLSGDSSVIGDCSLNSVVTEPTPGSLYGFSYGNFYGYGYGFFSGIYGYGTIGTGDYGYGLTTNVANQDVAGLYTLSLIGSPASIRIDVLESTEAADFFSSGVLPIGAEPGASISGTKYDDANGNGIKDLGEGGIEALPIEILVTDGSGFVLLNEFVFTDENGFWFL